MSSTTVTPSLTITSVSSTPVAAASAAAAAGHVQNLPAGTTISTVTVKQERHDEAEIQELAAKMVEAQKAAMAKQAQQQQLASRQVPAGQNIPPNSSGQANILNYLTRKPTNGQNGKAPGSASPEGGEKKTCDEESQKGHFGWATFGKIYIPYIARQSEKYCAVRMVEMKLLNKYLSYLHPDIYSSCTCVRSYYITEAESRLLNEINHKHCDAQFGRELFTLKDLVVRLSDATKFYQFLDICYRKLLTGSKSPSDKCGFIRINKESVVPYTVRNCEQVVPLFYFEGETENLRQKADYLSGWDLAYLKFCCKVQGIRNELFSSESVAVISLTDIKSYFPNGTEFEDYWPSKVVDSNLLIATKNPGNSVHWTRQPTAPPPKIINTNTNPPKAVQQQVRKPPYNTPNIQNPNGGQRMHSGPIPQSSQTGITAAVQALANGWSLAQAQAQAQAQSALPSVLTPAQTEQIFRAAAAQVHTQQQQQNQRNYAAANNRNQISNMMAGRQQYNTYNNGGMTMTTLNCSQTQQPPPLVRSASQNPAHMSTVAAAANAALQLHQQQQQQQQQRMVVANNMQNGRTNQQNQGIPSAAMHLQRQAAATVAASQPRLSVIPEYPTGSAHVAPYKVQKVFVFENTMVPCINMKAYNDSDQLMTLTDFKEYFYPQVSLDQCKRFIEALGVEMYKGNRRQIQTLIENGKPHSENIPLIKVHDIIKFMPQLRYMMRNHQEQPPNKRTRIS